MFTAATANKDSRVGFVSSKNDNWKYFHLKKFFFLIQEAVIHLVFYSLPYQIFNVSLTAIHFYIMAGVYMCVRPSVCR